MATSGGSKKSEEGDSPIFKNTDPRWCSKEESILLDAIDAFGYGNWDLIADLFAFECADKNFTVQDIIDHCNLIFGRDALGAVWDSQYILERRTFLCDHTGVDDVTFIDSSDLSAAKNLTPEQLNSIGYMPLREDFQTIENHEIAELMPEILFKDNYINQGFTGVNINNSSDASSAEEEHLHQYVDGDDWDSECDEDAYESDNITVISDDSCDQILMPPVEEKNSVINTVDKEMEDQIVVKGRKSRKRSSAEMIVEDKVNENDEELKEMVLRNRKQVTYQKSEKKGLKNVSLGHVKQSDNETMIENAKSLCRKGGKKETSLAIHENKELRISLRGRKRKTSFEDQEVKEKFVKINEEKGTTKLPARGTELYCKDTNVTVDVEKSFEETKSNIEVKGYEKIEDDVMDESNSDGWITDEEEEENKWKLEDELSMDENVLITDILLAAVDMYCRDMRDKALAVKLISSHGLAEYYFKHGDSLVKQKLNAKDKKNINRRDPDWIYGVLKTFSRFLQPQQLDEFVKDFREENKLREQIDDIRSQLENSDYAVFHFSTKDSDKNNKGGTESSSDPEGCPESSANSNNTGSNKTSNPKGKGSKRSRRNRRKKRGSSYQMKGKKQTEKLENNLETSIFNDDTFLCQKSCNSESQHIAILKQYPAETSSVCADSKCEKSLAESPSKSEIDLLDKQTCFTSVSSSSAPNGEHISLKLSASETDKHVLKEHTSVSDTLDASAGTTSECCDVMMSISKETELQNNTGSTEHLDGAKNTALNSSENSTADTFKSDEILESFTCKINGLENKCTENNSVYSNELKSVVLSLIESAAVLVGEKEDIDRNRSLKSPVLDISPKAEPISMQEVSDVGNNLVLIDSQIGSPLKPLTELNCCKEDSSIRDNGQVMYSNNSCEVGSLRKNTDVSENLKSNEDLLPASVDSINGLCVENFRISKLESAVSISDKAKNLEQGILVQNTEKDLADKTQNFIEPCEDSLKDEEFSENNSMKDVFEKMMNKTKWRDKISSLGSCEDAKVFTLADIKDDLEGGPKRPQLTLGQDFELEKSPVSKEHLELNSMKVLLSNISHKLPSSQLEILGILSDVHCNGKSRKRKSSEKQTCSTESKRHKESYNDDITCNSTKNSNEHINNTTSDGKGKPEEDESSSEDYVIKPNNLHVNENGLSDNEKVIELKSCFNKKSSDQNSCNGESERQESNVKSDQMSNNFATGRYDSLSVCVPDSTRSEKDSMETTLREDGEGKSEQKRNQSESSENKLSDSESEESTKRLSEQSQHQGASGKESKVNSEENKVIIKDESDTEPKETHNLVSPKEENDVDSEEDKVVIKDDSDTEPKETLHPVSPKEENDVDSEEDKVVIKDESDTESKETHLVSPKEENDVDSEDKVVIKDESDTEPKETPHTVSPEEERDVDSEEKVVIKDESDIEPKETLHLVSPKEENDVDYEEEKVVIKEESDTEPKETHHPVSPKEKNDVDSEEDKVVIKEESDTEPKETHHPVSPKEKNDVDSEEDKVVIKDESDTEPKEDHPVSLEEESDVTFNEDKVVIKDESDTEPNETHHPVSPEESDADSEEDKVVIKDESDTEPKETPHPVSTEEESDVDSEEDKVFIKEESDTEPKETYHPVSPKEKNDVDSEEDKVVIKDESDTEPKEDHPVSLEEERDVTFNEDKVVIKDESDSERNETHHPVSPEESDADSEEDKVVIKDESDTEPKETPHPVSPEEERDVDSEEDEEDKVVINESDTEPNETHHPVSAEESDADSEEDKVVKDESDTEPKETHHQVSPEEENDAESESGHTTVSSEQESDADSGPEERCLQVASDEESDIEPEQDHNQMSAQQESDAEGRNVKKEQSSNGDQKYRCAKESSDDDSELEPNQDSSEQQSDDESEQVKQLSSGQENDADSEQEHNRDLSEQESDADYKQEFNQISSEQESDADSEQECNQVFSEQENDAESEEEHHQVLSEQENGADSEHELTKVSSEESDADDEREDNQDFSDNNADDDSNDADHEQQSSDEEHKCCCGCATKDFTDQGSGMKSDNPNSDQELNSAESEQESSDEESMENKCSNKDLDDEPCNMISRREDSDEDSGDMAQRREDSDDGSCKGSRKEDSDEERCGVESSKDSDEESCKVLSRKEDSDAENCDIACRKEDTEEENSENESRREDSDEESCENECRKEDSNEECSENESRREASDEESCENESRREASDEESCENECRREASDEESCENECRREASDEESCENESRREASDEESCEKECRREASDEESCENECRREASDEESCENECRKEASDEESCENECRKEDSNEECSENESRREASDEECSENEFRRENLDEENCENECRIKDSDEESCDKASMNNSSDGKSCNETSIKDNSDKESCRASMKEDSDEESCRASMKEDSDEESCRASMKEDSDEERCKNVFESDSSEDQSDYHKVSSVVSNIEEERENCEESAKALRKSSDEESNAESKTYPSSPQTNESESETEFFCTCGCNRIISSDELSSEDEMGSDEASENESVNMERNSDEGQDSEEENVSSEGDEDAELSETKEDLNILEIGEENEEDTYENFELKQERYQDSKEIKNEEDCDENKELACKLNQICEESVAEKNLTEKESSYLTESKIKSLKSLCENLTLNDSSAKEVVVSESCLSIPITDSGKLDEVIQKPYNKLNVTAEDGLGKPNHCMPVIVKMLIDQVSNTRTVENHTSLLKVSETELIPVNKASTDSNNYKNGSEETSFEGNVSKVADIKKNDVGLGKLIWVQNDTAGSESSNSGIYEIVDEEESKIEEEKIYFEKELINAKSEGLTDALTQEAKGHKEIIHQTDHTKADEVEGETDNESVYELEEEDDDND